MPDLTDAQKVERARRAAAALDEFLDPAFVAVSEEYDERLKAICASKPWATNEIAALANAGRIVMEVRKQLRGLIADGEAAQGNIDRAKRIEELSPVKRRLLGIGQY